MTTLPQQRDTREPREPMTREQLAKHLHSKPGKSIVPFLAMYLDVLPDNTLLLPSEVASLYRVDVKTVSRWATNPDSGLIKFTTPGGHIRLKVKNVRELFNQSSGKVEVQG